jgi:branched-chain amino acid transport system substrate-binding protein
VTPTTIKIGLFGPLSGPNMPYGFDALKAAQMWYDKINKEGGINGRKIELAIEDDRCAPEGVIAAVKKLVEQDQIFMLHGGSCSAAVMPAKEYVVRNKIPWVTLDASADGAIYPPTGYIFSGTISQHSGGGSVVDFSSSYLKAKKIGYINHDDAFGLWNHEAADFVAREKKVDLIAQSIEPTITDVTAPLLKVLAGNPDVLVIATYARSAALIVKRAYELGFDKPIIVTNNASTNLDELVVNVGVKDAFKNFYVQDLMVDVMGGPKIKWVYDMYKQYYPDLAALPDHPNVYMPYGTVSAMVVVNALKAAGPDLTREKVRAAMSTLKFDTGILGGPIEFRPNDPTGNRRTTYEKFDGVTHQMLPGAYESTWIYQAPK